MPEENKPVEEQETSVEESKPTAEELLKNREAELARKDELIQRMRVELATKHEVKPQRDPNDMRTWADHELKAVLNNPSPEAAQWKEQVRDILDDRRLEAKLAARAETDKRVSAEMQLREKYPEALDPTSDLALRMDKIIQENDLSRTPAGRLVAAKLAAAELNSGKQTADARGRKMEQDRVNRVKAQMVDGDRPKPTSQETPEAEEKDMREKLLSEKSSDHKATGEWMDKSGLRDRFRKFWGEA